MIIGLGSDIVDIARIEQMLKRHGERFLRRVFCEPEQALAAGRQGQGMVAALAKRFAAKEAAVKALGCGFRHGIRWVDVEVRNDALGAPRLHLHAAAEERLQALLPAGHQPRLHLTLSDERRHALAVVIIEAVPAAGGDGN